MFGKKLDGLKVAVLVADGFEQVELTRPVKKLQKEGADVRIVSLKPGSIRGVNLLWPGKKVDVDHTVFSTDPSLYDALFIPGGFANPDFLRQSDKALEFAQHFDREGKPIATLCHGPWVLVSAKLTQGRRLTSWKGIADDVRNAGGLWEDSPVVRDRNWVSSRSPLDLRLFEKAMVELFQERAPRVSPGLAAREELRPRRRGRRLVRAAALAAGALVVTRAVAAARA